ncbi:hypothetical protein DL762_007444 [Monosporascus cannonballus]|uniref:Heterokaryon incompatibility domain-containing protein n=1 Tax=Monosporascus cannonballus TaxID=155416 RepID=A0ABY0H289_9PEZI|nr:hypothetical protein DL762_007444 [Monosporascus cannonballus]
MWLIRTDTLQLEYVTDAIAEGKPYAILSHCWEEGREVSFQEFCDLDLGTTRHKKGFAKISNACAYARKEKPPLDYCWVDTCCIDKKSSAELTEAINSMFKWYREAAVCYAYLHDLPGHSDLEQQLPLCRYFTRGWTLQELIAPRKMQFFDGEWKRCGTKAGLLQLLHKITNIPLWVLMDGDKVHSECIARRMSWAAHRQTGRVEDQAYCLLGIFGISMPMIYGEGWQAFRRLQEELIKDRHDRSIFAWKSTTTITSDSSSRSSGDDNGDDEYRGLLARSPREFAHCGRYVTQQTLYRPYSDFLITNRGVRFEGRLPIVTKPRRGCFLDLECCDLDPSGGGQTWWIGIVLHKTGNNGFVRVDPRNLYAYKAVEEYNPPYLRLPRFFAAKDLTRAGVDSIRTQYHQSLRVRLPSSAEILGVGPEDLWDATRNVFMTLGASIFVGYVLLEVEGDSSNPSYHKRFECILAVGMREANPRELDAEGQITVDSISGRVPWVHLWADPSVWRPMTRTGDAFEPELFLQKLKGMVPNENEASNHKCVFEASEVEASVSTFVYAGERAFDVEVRVGANVANDRPGRIKGTTSPGADASTERQLFR